MSFFYRSPPIIVNGSFGSGKTQLLAVATHCLIKCGMLNGQPVRILLCAHHQSSADHFINKYFGPLLLRREQYEQPLGLIRLMSRSYHIKDDMFKNYYMHSQDLHNNVHHYQRASYLIVVTTFLTSLSLPYKLRSGFFTHILLDEGSQSREPEAIAPLCSAGPNTKLVIAGDSHQVSHLL